MRTAAQFTTPPSDYRLVVPDGWYQLALEPEHATPPYSPSPSGSSAVSTTPPTSSTS
ncbi:hypothetical protein [Streptomyces sp. NPDC007088]|uniref:hypothetical protein n=1 Tax=Streptomyces sp. NPDC007088 TaxID=3364773 RepID=UPI00367D5546